VLHERIGDRLGHLGPWPERAHAAWVCPIGPVDGGDGAVAVLGVSPRLRFDDAYRGFFRSIAGRLAARLAAEQAERAEREAVGRERAALREAELQREHLVELLTRAPTPMLLLRGPELRIELANARMCATWRRSAEDVVGRALLEAVPELVGQPFEHVLAEVWRTGVAHVGREDRGWHVGPDGRREESWFHDVCTPLRDVRGEVDGILAIRFDVTAQVYARREVDALRAAAEDANRAKDDFLAMLGHELRNPLAPIVTALQLMKARAPDVLERERAIVERQVAHLRRLIDDLLDVSRITRGRVALRRRPIELGEVVAAAVEATSPLLEQQRHVLHVDVADRLLVDGDPTRLAQVVANLLTNAAKYTDPGGRIDVVAAREGDGVVLTVRDTGVGIPGEVLPRVFDPFAQAPQALDRAAGGLGLGLAIVRGLVAAHGGTVAASSDGPGLGTSVVVRLPALAAPAPVEADDPRADAPPSGARRRVLVVDDNRDAAELLAEALGVAGHDVRVAFDGPGALHLAAAFRPDLGLLDIGLPVMDGYELARRLREAHPDVGLVAVTGYGQREDVERARRAGFDGHLVKPVELGRLFDVLAALAARAGSPA
jgi:signal transduction histidine kinase/ActR/RegA family two-component response regulator